MDLVRKAKQIELLIESLPSPEPEESQVSGLFIFIEWSSFTIHAGHAPGFTGTRDAKG